MVRPCGRFGRGPMAYTWLAAGHPVSWAALAPNAALVSGTISGVNNPDFGFSTA